jgi:hypothetical protein
MFVVLHLVSRINGHYRDGCTSSLMQHIQVSVLHCKGDNTLRLSKLNCCLKIELHRTCKKVANSCTAAVQTAPGHVPQAIWLFAANPSGRDEAIV